MTLYACTGDVTAVMIQVSPIKSLLVISVYFSPSEPIEPVLRALTRVLGSSGGVNAVTMGDFNSNPPPVVGVYWTPGAVLWRTGLLPTHYLGQTNLIVDRPPTIKGEVVG